MTNEWQRIFIKGGVLSPGELKRVIELGTTQELANHTMLYSKNGVERAIADSASPIILENGEIIRLII